MSAQTPAQLPAQIRSFYHLWASFPGFGDAPLELMIIWQWPWQINVVLTFLKWKATNFSYESTLFCTDECIFKVFWAADQINTGIRRVSLSALPSPEICWGSFSEWEITSRCIWVLIVQDNDNEICAFGVLSALASFHRYFQERKYGISVTWPSSRTSATLLICAWKAFSQFGQFDQWSEVEICSTERVSTLVAFQLGSSRLRLAHHHRPSKAAPTTPKLSRELKLCSW
jgi:hypothetical protein